MKNLLIFLPEISGLSVVIVDINYARINFREIFEAKVGYYKVLEKCGRTSHVDFRASLAAIINANKTNKYLLKQGPSGNQLCFKNFLS